MSRFNEPESMSRPKVSSAILAVVLSVAVVTAAGTVLWATMLLAGQPGRRGLLYAGLIFTEAVGVALPALVLARAGGHDMLRLFRLRKPAAFTWAPTVLIAVSGFVLASSLEEWTQRIFGPLPALDWEAYAPHGPFEMALALPAMAVAPALAEELLYRGYVLRAFERLGSRLPVSLLVGAIFSAAHLSPGTFFALMFLGTAITWVVMIADSIYSGMVIHAVVNGLAVVLWRSDLVERLPDSLADNLAAIILFSAGTAWLARASRPRQDAALEIGAQGIENREIGK